MTGMDRIYHLTEAGRRALERLDSGLPQAIRQLLGAVGSAAHFAGIAARLSRYGECDILARLEDLVAIGLVESIALEWLAELVELGTYAPEPMTAPR
jgi:hypothetical protein